MNIRSTTLLRFYDAINKNKVTFWGFLGDSEFNILGYTINPSKSDYKKIFYYKSDKYWRKLQAVANRLSGQ
ncbi:hypothetical protein, partial [Klebsiella pneumoniae]